ncbi:hypothetical protein BC937DRAFT_90327 [Endogone sp. FLAS-F59071]|nr:hypothetical protein BC937DRAFT_90327 [Endogone sp. FLAS-F59071]|eukprot:RUS17159.1 hypothetical protein BC937DRAFT_90327 [Endogone sp. FLAS-F59071]
MSQQTAHRADLLRGTEHLTSIPPYLRTSHNAPPSPPLTPTPSPSSSADQPSDFPGERKRREPFRSSFHGFSSQRHHQLIQYEFAVPGSAPSPSKSEHWFLSQSQDTYSQPSQYAIHGNSMVLPSSAALDRMAGTTMINQQQPAATDSATSLLNLAQRRPLVTSVAGKGKGSPSSMNSGANTNTTTRRPLRHVKSSSMISLSSSPMISLSSSPVLATAVTTTAIAKAHILSRKSSASIDNIVRSSAIAAKRNSLSTHRRTNIISSSAPMAVAIDYKTRNRKSTLRQLHSPLLPSSLNSLISPTPAAFSNYVVDTVREDANVDQDDEDVDANVHQDDENMDEFIHSASLENSSSEEEDEEVDRRSISNMSQVDIFDDLRRKIANVTYTLQKFQIRELSETEKKDDDDRRKRRKETESERMKTESKRSSDGESSVLSGTTLASLTESTHTPNRRRRRSSVCTTCMKHHPAHAQGHSSNQRTSSSSLGSLLSSASLPTKWGGDDRRTPIRLVQRDSHKHQHQHPFGVGDGNGAESGGEDEEEEEEPDEDDGPTPGSAQWSPASPFRQSDHLSPFSMLEEDEHPGLSTSPNLATLFLTTNALLSSRMDELSLSISAATSPYDAASSEWQAQFISLVSSCISQSEQLEAVSTQQLESERRVRELLFVKREIEEDLDVREKEYCDRIDEVRQVMRDQQRMIDGLEELMGELMGELEGRVNSLLLMGSGMGPIGTGAIIGPDGEVHRIKRKDKRWTFGDTLREVVKMNEMEEVVAKVKLEVGRVIGASSTNRMNDISSDLNSNTLTSVSGTQVLPAPIGIQSSPVYRYFLNLSAHDRRTGFTLLPQEFWVEDADVTRCQSGEMLDSDNNIESSTRCGVMFSWFQRRHHCRSSNRLLLFPPITNENDNRRGVIDQDDLRNVRSELGLWSRDLELGLSWRQSFY